MLISQLRRPQKDQAHLLRTPHLLIAMMLVLSVSISQHAQANTTRISYKLKELSADFYGGKGTTGTLKFKAGDQFEDEEFVVSDVIDPAYLPEGRNAVEDFEQTGSLKSLIVHKMDANGCIYDVRLSYENAVIAEYKPTYRVYDAASNKWDWFEILDASRGYFYPLSDNQLVTSSPKHEIPEGLIGVKNFAYPGVFIQNTAKKGGVINADILKAYAKPENPWPAYAKSWNAYLWQTDNGERWSLFPFQYNRDVLKTKKFAFHLSFKNVLSDKLSAATLAKQKLVMRPLYSPYFPSHKLGEYQTVVADVAEPSKILDRVIILAERESQKFELLQLFSNARQFKRLSVLDSNDPETVTAAIEKSQAAAQDAANNNTLKPTGVTEAELLARHANDVGQCFIRIHDQYFSKRNYSGGYRAAKPCDQRSYTSVIKKLAEVSPNLLSDDELRFVASQNYGAAAASNTLANRNGSNNSANGRSGSAGGNSYGLGRASREQYANSVRGSDSRRAEQQSNDQMRRSLDRIGKRY